ncbi:MAG: SusF/SusE family outer membrane protein, partial [Bacteroidales bacterium]|nr:SusF/SusE family outer membrane protein [Bacteroidales bacterium]
GGEFRFPMQRDWWPCLMIAMDGETLVLGHGDDEKTGFAVDETAIYKIVCDIDNMKASITKTGDIAPAEFPTLFMCGSATPYGWSTVMTDDNQLKPVDNSNVNVLSWTGELKADGTFKFLTTSDWIPSYNRDASASDYWTLAYRENYEQPDEQFAVSEDGTYKVVVDLDAMKVTCTKEEATDSFDYTPSAAYNDAANLWKAVDAAKAVEFFSYMNIAADWSNPKYDNVAATELPFVEAKESTYKLTLDDQTFDRWQNQFYIHPYGAANYIPLDPAKTYKFSVTLQSTEAFGAFFKLSKYNPDGGPKYEGEAIWEPAGYPDNVNFEAGKPIVLEQEITGVEAPNVNLIFDFGKNPAGTVVYIKDIILSEVGGGSESVSITVDGDFSDWAAVSGGLNSEEGPYLVCKAVNDDNYLYIYSKRTWHDGLWKDSSGGYYYYEFDTDNDEGTGSNDVNGNTGYGVEAWMYLYLFTGSSSAPTFASSPKGSGYPSSSVINDVLAAGKTDMSIIETEVRIPLSNISVTKGQTIRIYTWGNKSASNFKNAKESILMTLK